MLNIKLLLATLFFICLLLASHAQTCIRYDKTRDGFIVFHPIATDANGKILPWNNSDLAVAYDQILSLTWAFWDTMKRDINGLPYYMNHQVWWQYGTDPRGMGGDQLAMALSSFQLYYAYTGNEKIKENMKFIAEYYLINGLSPAQAAWPYIPYPYNSFVYGGKFDGDMVAGKYFTQPDKAGSFGYELLKLYKMCKQRWYSHAHEDLYLQYAIQIANTLAQKTTPGNADNSPLPFKVNALTGEVGMLKSNDGKGNADMKSSYTTNWAGTLCLLEDLVKLKKGDTVLYKKAHAQIITWVQSYPIKTNKWGPFFEDVPGWSDTQINAVTMAQYIMMHPQLFPNWKNDIKSIFSWVYEKLGNKDWDKYGVLAINEQTAYQTPGNSHTSRQGCAELQYASLAGDTTLIQGAIRKLNWATYMVDNDGKNCYMNDEVWLTDGYGDYMRHYLRAMAALPSLCPPQNHIIHTTDIICQVDYAPDFNKRMAKYVTDEETKTALIYYKTFENASTETIRMTKKPSKVTLDWKPISEDNALKTNTWKWTPMKQGGLFKINKNGYEVKIFD
ncbi:MAG: hypothetical protein NW207_03420 [Cytophagales bacterium]|nr:hypothetical protein [Cytophagales bacterium]